ncbi:MAG: exodeoxyribonuclease V subunit beta [Alphaproteobacteria bacterium]|nr:exodeoxyribonuclease V subunit beta [Alphaproteobacteria bacterium]
MMTERPPLLALDLPLKGLQLIEASAGTGKTWTLSALYVRLVLGHGRGGLDHGLLPPQILVMTFTEAATAELRDRIRKRLLEAAHAFAQTAGLSPKDAFVAGLREQIPPEQWAACAQRLMQAVSWMDEAAIHTIHGWSMRALREHAFASRSLFDLQHLQDADQLWLELARDHVRQFVYPLSATDLQALEAEKLTPNPTSWIDALAELRRELQRSPHPPKNLDELQTPAQVLATTSDWLAQENRLLEVVRQHFDQPLAESIQAYKDTHKDVLGHLKRNHIEGVLKKVMTWVQGHELTTPHDQLLKLGHRQMVQKKWPAEPAHLALCAIDVWIDWQAQKPAPVREAVLQHALHRMLHQYTQIKAEAGLFDFQDLLERLYWALCDSTDLAHALRTQYPVALVDEFQDTDPWQYGALDRIYAPDADGVLVMIGDPKQAIYSFRGADIATYVRAREKCVALDPHSQHNLRQNRRSTPKLLAVLNDLFRVHPDLFGPQIGFEAALPTPINETPALDQPIQVVISEGGGASNAEAHRAFLLAHAIEHMVGLLNSHQAQPQDLAVLVRTHGQAAEVVKALTRSGIAAVYLSDRSQVYQSDEARDLWLVLRALAQPRHAQALRAALGTPLWGLSTEQLLAQTGSDEAWDALLDQALQWHQHWRSSGVLPMLRQWLLDTGAAARLLKRPDGERRLTNLLHLAELLQQATHPMTAQGIAALPHATVRHLGREIRRKGAEDGPAQTRLESDEKRVRVVSFHKSKGLQYKHVYIPFLSSGQAAPEARSDSDEDAEVDRSRDVLEDTRLLYVAMTRAERSLWLGVYAHKNEINNQGISALCRWLDRTDKKKPWSDIWNTLAGDIAGLGVSVPLTRPTPQWQAPDEVPMQGGPRPAPQLHLPPWWSASFSALTRQLGDKPTMAWQTQAEQAEREIDSEELHVDETGLTRAQADLPWQDFGAGAIYGTLLHDLLQWQAEHDWPLARGESGPAWQTQLDRQMELKPQEQAMITPWLQQVVNTPLPLSGANPVVLGDLRQPRHWAEMPFHFSVGTVSTQAIDRLICADVFADQPRPALLPATLGGMVNGFIDLVFEHDGRYWVLDYKSNKLDHYDPDSLQRALLDKRYDVQSVIYLLALHRLLQHRVRGYDPARHLGGAAYLFMRGIGAAGAGVVMQRPSVALITALDALLQPMIQEAA